MPSRRAALAALLLAACAPAKQSWSEAVPARPEVFVDVLPRTAELRLDGVPFGEGPLAVPLPAAPAVIDAVRSGFEGGKVEVDPRRHAGARVGLVLRPVGYGEARALDIDEPAGLTAAAAFLLQAGKLADAVEFSGRAVELAPAAPAPRRVRGLAQLRLGRKAEAAAELSEYLQLAPPEAPDRAELERTVGQLRGDLSFPAPKG